MIEKPKKERRFLKALGRVGEILIQEVLIKIGSNLIKKIGGKKTLPSILFLLASLSLFAQYPATGNKQRLGFQTTGDGLVYRGRAADTVGIKSSGLNNAYFILDTVNNVLFNYIKTKGGWVFNNTDTVINNITVDTTSLSNRINLKLNISDTASMLTPYFKDADTTSLNLTSRFAAKLNLSDTASMLTNYLRTGVAASTYLTQANAASTYLPLTGGTLTGLLRNTSQRLTGNITISDFDNTYNTVQISPSSSATVNLAIQQNLSGAANISMGGNQGGGGNFFNPNIYFTDNRKAYASIGGIHTSSGTDNQSGHIVFTTTPSLNSIALTERMRIAQDGAITMGGTLGVTGATTLSAPLTVNSSAVFNEGSTDSDFRVESDGNVNMVFVDASTDRVGIGTASPTKTLDVNGTLVVTGIANFSNQMTISGSVSGSNRLLGKNTSNDGVGDITVGTGLDLTGNNLTASGTDTTSLSNRINLKYDKTGGTISGAVTLSTTSATPTSLLGKDGSNVVGEVTTVAQTGLMTRGETTATTGSPSATFTVTHGLGTNPSAIIVTSAGIGGAEKIIYEVYTKSSTTFSVQAWNYDGTEASSKSVKIYWLAIK